MFTGLVQTTGRLARRELRGGDARLVLAPDRPLPELEDGESIAVNGACLTVERHDQTGFTVYASGETLARTTLGSLAPGTLVNLERALRLGERLGGHLVAGHVDCLAVVESVSPAGRSLQVRLGFPEDFGAEVAPKGSVALDGISLTVNECGAAHLTVNVIPETRARTAMRLWRPGSRVNMETDVLAKYVRRCLSSREAPAPSAVTRDYLLENGFL